MPLRAGVPRSGRVGRGLAASALPQHRVLAPGKEIRTLVDSSAAYFARKEPTKLEIAVTYRDEDGARRQATIAHDLGIYRDLAYVAPAAEGTEFTD